MGRRPDPGDVFGSAVQWAVHEDSYKLSGAVTNKLPAGVYDCVDDGWGNAQLDRMDLKLDELISFPDTVHSAVVDRIRKFWKRRAKYHEYKFLHRMGYLLYGPQGCGKSSLVYQIMNDIIADGHLCLLCQGRVDYFTQCVDAIRQIEPDRPMVCVIEDIDTHLARGGENELLQWLDGANKTDHVVVIATTNYPEKLDKRIVCRPRRFDRVVFIGKPNHQMRWEYFATKLSNISHTELYEWTEVSEGLSFAGLAELVLSVRCMDEDLYETAALLKKLESRRPMSADFMEAAGEDEDEDEDENDEEDTFDVSKDEDLPVDAAQPRLTGFAADVLLSDMGTGA